MGISNKEQGISNIEGELRMKKYFILPTRYSKFLVPCSKFSLFIQKTFHILFRQPTRLFEIIIHDILMKMMFKRNFIRGFIDPVLKAFGRFRAAAFEPFFELVNGGRFYKK